LGQDLDGDFLGKHVLELVLNPWALEEVFHWRGELLGDGGLKFVTCGLLRGSDHFNSLFLLSNLSLNPPLTAPAEQGRTL
jgi:hypothetical protein